MAEKQPSSSDDSQSRRSSSPRPSIRFPSLRRSSSPRPSIRSPSLQLVASSRFTEESSLNFLDNLKTGELIGQGSYGKVYIALHEPDNTQYAIKKVPLDHLDPSQYDLVQNEVANMLKVSHPGILKLENALTWTTFVVIVMPLMAYSSCDQIIRRAYPTGLPEVAIGLIIKDVINGVMYLHSKKIIHRTIKASHILIKESGEAVLSGFRHMITMPRDQDRMTVQNIMTEMSHYINWLSPEMLVQDSRGFGLNSDMYSIGITICELANGVVPYSDVSPTGILVKKLEEPPPKLWDKHFLPSQERAGVTPAYFDNTPPVRSESSVDHAYQHKSFTQDIKKFVALCTVATPESRITVDQATKFKFYTIHANASAAALVRTRKLGPLLRYRSTIEVAGQSQAAQSPPEPGEWDIEDTTRPSQ